MDTLKERLKKNNIDSEAAKREIVISLFRILGNKTKEEIELLETSDDSIFKFVGYAIQNAYMNGIFDGQMLEIKEEHQRFMKRWDNEYKLSNSPKTDSK